MSTKRGLWLRTRALNDFASIFFNESEAALLGVVPASKADLQKAVVKLLDLISGLSGAIAAADIRIAYLESQIDLSKVPKGHTTLCTFLGENP